MTEQDFFKQVLANEFIFTVENAPQELLFLVKFGYIKYERYLIKSDIEQTLEDNCYYFRILKHFDFIATNQEKHTTNNYVYWCVYEYQLTKEAQEQFRRLFPHE